MLPISTSFLPSPPNDLVGASILKEFQPALFHQVKHIKIDQTKGTKRLGGSDLRELLGHVDVVPIF